MLILSFRDMTTARCSAVTSAAAYGLDTAMDGFAWKPAPGGGLRLADWGAVEAALKDKHVCFLVHGFNVDRDGGYTALGAMAQELAGHGALLQHAGGAIDLAASGVDVVVPVLWAGDWYLPINYPFLLGDIRMTAEHFAEFIWSTASQMRRVSFITHSMGARVVIETVQRAVAEAVGDRRAPAFDTAVFTAGAIPDDCLDLPDFADAVAAFRQIVVVSSLSDTVLSGDFPAGNAVEQALWKDDHGDDSALGLKGPKLAPDSAARGKTRWFEIPRGDFQRHNDYLPSPLSNQPAAGWANGWSDKRVRIGEIAQAALDGAPAPLSANPIP